METRTEAVPFTQFMHPTGTPKAVEAAVTTEYRAKAYQFIDAGGKFTCEVLRTGEVVLYGEHVVDDEPQDIAIVISPNGPEIHAATEEVINKSLEWLRQHKRTQ